MFIMGTPLWPLLDCARLAAHSAAREAATSSATTGQQRNEWLGRAGPPDTGAELNLQERLTLWTLSLTSNVGGLGICGRPAAIRLLAYLRFSDISLLLALEVDAGDDAAAGDAHGVSGTSQFDRARIGVRRGRSSALRLTRTCRRLLSVLNGRVCPRTRRRRRLHVLRCIRQFVIRGRCSCPGCRNRPDDRRAHISDRLALARHDQPVRIR